MMVVEPKRHHSWTMPILPQPHGVAIVHATTWSQNLHAQPSHLSAAIYSHVCPSYAEMEPQLAIVMMCAKIALCILRGLPTRW
jgi:hypothetical protein